MYEIPRIERVWYYKAPYGTSPSPRTIPEGRQEIEIITAGRGFYEFQGRVAEAVPGTILWHWSGDETIYMNDPENPYECIVIVFEQNGGCEISGMCQWLDRVSFQVFIDNVLTEYHSETPDIPSLSCYAYGQLCWQMRNASKEPSAQNRRHDGIERVIGWIDANYNRDIGVEKLAEMAGLSVPHLHTVFRELIRQTPYQYIQSRRILEARKLLAMTRLSVKEVCIKSGFNDLGNFCRFFKRTHGMTAQEYRQLHADKR